MEYFGPIIIYLALFYKNLKTPHVTAWMFHFIKREFETFFVHRFSNETMPVRNLFKNCGYYWVFAIFVGTGNFSIPETQYLVLFYVCELLNAICHL